MHSNGGYAAHIRVPCPKYLFDIGDLDPEFAELMELVHNTNPVEISGH